jgi:diguanylate cyclase (GGDEF)-like protein
VAAVRRRWQRALLASFPPARRRGGTSDATDRFRERHVRLGVLLSLASIAEVGGYLWLGHPHADPLPLLLLSGLAAVANVCLWPLAPRVSRLRFHSIFFVAWSGGTTVLILVGAALDGGEESPFVVLLFLPMLYAAQAYPPMGALLLGIEGAFGFLIVAISDATPDHAGTAVMAGSLTLASLMAMLSASNREQQAHELQVLTAVLESDANHDSLTKCLNRRGFDGALEAEVARSQRYGRPLSLLLFDVDHLKDINDQRGHAAGDQALLQVAAALHRVVRRNDVAARFGGDEFALLTPELTVEAAAAVGARLHGALRAQNGTERVTVSIGVAGLGGTTTTPGQLVRAADAAMYRAKSAGRNRTATIADQERGPQHAAAALA